MVVISHEFQPVNSTQEVPRTNTNNSVLDNFITLIKTRHNQIRTRIADTRHKCREALRGSGGVDPSEDVERTCN